MLIEMPYLPGVDSTNWKADEVAPGTATLTHRSGFTFGSKKVVYH
jgi:hypothetical protein